MPSTTHAHRAARTVLARALGGLVLCSSLALCLAGVAGAKPLPARPPAANKYIGADKCKSCHSAAESGDQNGSWTKTLHSHAFAALATEEAKKVAAEKGVADPATDAACVSCHVTAYGVPDEQIKKGFDRAQGIQCEACHGPGEAHMKARFAAAAKGAPAEGYVQVPADEIVASPKQDTCRQCHNEKSPSYKPFCFHEFNAKIRHLNPKKPREAIDIGECSCPKCANGCPESCKELTKVR